MRLQNIACKVFADYHQFYLWDSGTNPEAPTEYDDADMRRRIKVGPNVVAVQTEHNRTVAVEIEIHDAEPEYDSNAWDHIAEASLNLPTGKLQVHECTGGPVADFTVEPGWYRVRTFHGGFDSLDESSLEGNDHYRVVLWPKARKVLRIVKQYNTQ